MQEKVFREFMRKTTYVKNGVEKHYTESAINKRISSLHRVERELKIDIEDYVFCSATTKSLLSRIQRENLDKPYDHRTLQNAIRRYYEFINGGNSLD